MSCKIQDFQFDGMQLNEKPNDVRIFYDNDCKLRFSYGGDLNVNYNGEVVTLSGYRSNISVNNPGEVLINNKGEVLTEAEVLINNKGEVLTEAEVLINNKGEVLTEAEVLINNKGEVLTEAEVLINNKGEVLTQAEVQPEIMTFSSTKNSSKCNYGFESVWNITTNYVENNIRNNTSNSNVKLIDDNNFDLEIPNLKIKYEFKRSMKGDNYTSTHCFSNICPDLSNSKSLSEYSDNIKLPDLKFCTINKASDDKCPEGSMLMSEYNSGLPDLPGNKCMYLSDNYANSLYP